MREYLVKQNNNAKNLCDGLGSPMGTSQYHNIGLCLITDGVKDLADKFDCAWLIVKMAVMTRMVFEEKRQYTQVWKLCIKNHHATLYCLGHPLPPDYDVDEVVYSENIKYTNLPDGEMLFKVGIGEPPIICLPIED